MTDVLVHRLERAILEETAFRNAVADPPATEAHAVLMRRLEQVRPEIGRREAMQLEAMIAQRTGVGR